MSIPRNRIDRTISLSRQISKDAVPQTSSSATTSDPSTTTDSTAPAGSETGHVQEPKNFAPKKPVQLNPPKDDSITQSELSKCDGSDGSKPTLVAIKGTVFDVSGNKAYGVGGQYHVFAGKDPSRALAMSSLKPEDAIPYWQDLEDKEKTVLEEWFTFFSKRYNIVGRVVEDDASSTKSSGGGQVDTPRSENGLDQVTS